MSRQSPRKHRWALLTGVLATALAGLSAQAQPTGDGAPQPTPAEKPEDMQPKVTAEEARMQCLSRLGRGGGLPTLPNTSQKMAPKELSPLEKGALDEIEGDYKRYEDAWHDHNKRMLTILKREYEERRTKLDERYTKKISAAEKEERRRHLEAIALLEQFIQQYPDNEQFTPDAMFRLADLYLDEAEYQFDKRQEALAAGQVPEPTGDGTDEGPLDIADYSKSLGLWQDISSKFPKYRQHADVLYLTSYYLKQTGEERRALQVARGLVCGNKFNPTDEPPPAPDRETVRAILASGSKAPFSDPYEGCQAVTDNDRLVQEAWVRLIGDNHFYTPGELNEAISAYQRVADNKKSKYYDEALYKLAWSFYRNDDFLKGIQAFDESILYSDSLVAQGKAPLELRQEAVQYIAISFTDPWSLSEQSDPVRSWQRVMDFYGGRLSEPHIRDVFVQLGETYKILQSYPQAIDAWRIALKHTPLHPRNPIVHQSIVTAFEAMGDKDAADDEAAKLASTYAICGEWYLANEMNPEAMEDQRKIGERMLRAAAENTHRAAQEARKEYEAAPNPQARAYYVDLYAKAASLYKQFIETYPTADQSYEFTYRLGETSFFSEQYLASIPYYRWVRDHKELSERRFEKAAKSIVQAYEKEIEKQIAAGQLSEPPVPTIDELRQLPRPIQAKTVPELYGKLRNAYDEYQQLVNEPQTAPDMGLRAALVSYRHLDLGDAEKRFQVVVKKFCGTPQALQAKDAVLAIYEVQGESAKFKATNDSFIASKCGTDADIQLAKAQNQAREFRDAEELFKNKQYDEAAIAFYRYYKTAKPDDPSLPVALYDSAISYERSGRPKTAVYLFQEFTSNPRKEFRQSEYYVEALFLTAKAQQKAFDNAGAVDTYLQTAAVANEKGRKQPPGERSLKQIRLDSLYNAALLREIDRVYKDPSRQPGTGAASLYKTYADLETDARKRDRAYWQIAQVWRSAGDARKMDAAFAEWRRKFGSDEGNATDYVMSFYLTAKLYEQKGYKKDSQSMRDATIKAWEKVGRPQQNEAADMAAEFAFRIAEDNYLGKFDPWKIKRAPRTEKEAKQVLDDLNKISDEAKAKYDALAQYSSSFWSQAALVRVGDVRFFQALKLQQAPVPKEIEKLDAKYPEKEILLRYEEAIEQKVKPLTDAAKTQWQRVAEAAKRAGVSNKWTKLAQERLHDFVSQDEFPVLRDELVSGTTRP